MIKDDLTPAMRQYKEIKHNYPDTFLFFRMGDFYEMFYEDAVEGSKILDIALTSRSKGKDGEPIPLCGVPYHSVDIYLSKMIRAGKKVAICEQVEDPKKAIGVVKRAVVRVVTPGTATEESILITPYQNYIAAVLMQSEKAGCAFADLATGEFQVVEMDGSNPKKDIEELLSQFQPRELLLPESRKDEAGDLEYSHDMLITGVEDWAFGKEYAEGEIKKQFGVSHLEGFGITGTTPVIGAAGALIYYLRETQFMELGHIRSIRKLSRSKYLIIDSASRRNLELIISLYGEGTTGSLLSILDGTVTGMGKRLLRSWLLRPLKEKSKIVGRLDAVEEIFNTIIERAELRKALKRIADLERIIGRVTLRSGGPRDLVALKVSLAQLPRIREHLAIFKNRLFNDIYSGFDLCSDVHDLIERAIEDHPPITVREGGIIKENYNAELDELRAISSSGKQYIAGIEAAERKRSRISNLKVRYNKVFGYYIEVSRSNLDKVPDDYIRKQTLVNAERFITPELKEYEAKVLNAEDKINDLEYELFNSLREQVRLQGFRIQEMAMRLAVIDVISSFAELAAYAGYVRPEILDEDIIDIKDGRHPVVERLNLSEKFVPNDCLIDSAKRILIITGPNMGGKSTYLRQVALIVIMAQIGSFVPAKSARIGVVDRLFTRVGASDSLVQGRSTFLVEMQESADILNNATPKSLVILDEIGRGTSTFDGLSLAWAVIEYLCTVKQVKARTLFATHYHELTELEKLYSDIKNLNLSVKEWKDQIIFLRKVVEGRADKSYGIQVAKLAGVPGPVIERAKEILSTLEDKEFDAEGNPILGRESKMKVGQFAPIQQTLFTSYIDDPLIEELKKIDLNRITPIESLSLLEKIQRKLKKR